MVSHPDGRKLTYFEASREPCTKTSPCPSCAVSHDDYSEYLETIVLNPSEEKL